MTNNTSTFTPSTQILEAGEKAQALADAGQTLKPFLPPEAQQAVEGIDKVAQAFTATGRALEHFGFDEAEMEVTTSDVELIPTDHSPVVDNLNPTWGDLVPDSLRPSTFVIAGGQVLQETGWKATGQAIETAGQVMRAFGFDEAEADGLTGTGPTLPAIVLDPRFVIGGGPAPIDIEPGDPIFQEMAERLRASKQEADGLTGTGPTLPAIVLDPRFVIGGGPAPIDIEPGDPIFQEMAERLRASKQEADGLTGTGPTMPAFDEDEDPSLSEAMKDTAGVLGAVGGIVGATGGGAPAGAAAGVAAGVLYLGGTILGAFGLDVDESEPYIPEVGVDALA